MEREITIVDRGRGPQLCTSRITVQDLLPYFQLGYTDEQIIQEVMPSLSVAEIGAARRYVEDHREEVLEEDQRIRQRNAALRNPPEVEAVLQRAQKKLEERLDFFRNHRAEGPNGDGRSG
ncbi:MAG TPA: DUF433 domain-containing protein [Pirellulales bacterium]|nr:DUF433 domain-containing protein [Pirellulales bacterium]